MKIDPRHLAQLSVVVEAGSFQVAAERLGITQPALSRNVKTLEARLGAAVFDRTGRRSVPTELGKRLARNGLAIRLAQEQAETYADRAQSGSAGELRIGAPPIVAGRFLSDTLSLLLKENPQSVAELRVGLVHELRTLLDRGSIDLIIGPRSLAESAAGLVFELIVDDSVGILCRVGHPLLKEKRPSPDLLEQQRWVAHSRGSLLRQQTENGLVAYGLENINIACETDSIRTVFEIIENTDMITTMPRESTKPYLEDRCAFLDLDQPQFHRPIGVVRRRAQQQSQLEKQFVSMLKMKHPSQPGTKTQ